jgi:hypothetical protein
MYDGWVSHNTRGHGKYAVVKDCNSKGIGVIQPILVVMIQRRIIFGCGSPRETIGSGMLVSRDMNEFKIKQENTCNPPIDRRVGLQIRIIDHTLDVLRIDLDSEVCDAKDPYVNHTEGSEESV